MPDLFDAQEQSTSVSPEEVMQIVEAPEEESSVSGEAAATATSEQDPANLIEHSDQIPEELQPIYKKMQAGFTKKSQALSEQAKKAQDLEQRLPELQKKAELMDKLLANPTMLRQLAAAQDAGQPAASGPVAFYDVDVSKLEDVPTKQVKQLAMLAFQEHGLPVIQAIVAKLNSIEQELALNDWQAVAGQDSAMQAKAVQVSQFLQENPNFFKSSPRQVRLKKALSVLQEDSPGVPAATVTPKNNGNVATPNRRAAQVARPDLPAGQVMPKTSGKTLLEILKETRRELGAS